MSKKTLSKGTLQDLVRGLLDRKLSRRQFIARALALGVSASALGSLLQSPTLAQGQAELLFTFWGSPLEKQAIEDMVAAFNASHPDIHVTAQHIPNNAYEEKMSTMLAGGTPPDVAYLGDSTALSYAEQGALLDLSDYFASDPEASSRLPTTYYRYDGDKTLGTNTAAEAMILYYNKKLFDDAGVAYPPSKAENAWSWDQFVEAAQKLTKDRSGNDATSPDFDPDKIRTYGVALATWWAGYVPLIYSNGGRFANEDGTELLLNSPEAVEVLQQMQDLIYKYHVAPTPAQSEAMPATDVMMQSGQVAMDMNGHWKVLDYSNIKGLDWGMGVFPKFKDPVTILLGSPTVIFASTKYPDAAFEFYKFHNDPTQVDLYKQGLWMPLQEEYYTDPAMTAQWLDGIEGVYPPEARDVLVDYTLNDTPLQPPAYWLKNLTQINQVAVDPAMDLLWTGKMTAQEAMDQAVANAKPLMQGRW